MTDLELYRNDELDKRVLLDFGAYRFSNADISEDMTLSETLNPDGQDFMIGTAMAAQLQFTLNNLYQTIPAGALTGKEFTYYEGAETETADLTGAYKATGAELLLEYGGRLYASHGRAPFLTVWDAETLERLPDPQQPAQPPETLYIVDGTLYCASSGGALLEAYTLPEMAYRTVQPENDFQRYKLARFCETGAAFVLENGTRTEYERVYYDLKVRTYLAHVFRLHQIGVFLAEKPERQNDNDIAVTAYDRMTKADVVIDSWYNALTFPITAGELLKGLCSHLGIPLETTDFLNAGFSIRKNFSGENITGRQVIQWVAQLAASFARCSPAGGLRLGWYEEKPYTLEDVYYEVEIAEYTTAPVDKLQVRTTENDIGVVVGDGENAYIIENNPLLYAESDAELRSTVQSIFDAIKAFTYTPYSVSAVWGTPLLRAGDIIRLRTVKGQEIPAVIMSYELRGVRALSFTLSATGSQRRETQSDAVNQSIQQLRGKSNELVRTIEQTRNTIADTEKGLKTEIVELSDSITATITSINGTISTLRVDLKGLDHRVEDSEGTIATLSNTVDGFQATFATKDGVKNEIKSAVGGIGLSVENGEKSAAIQLTSGGEILGEAQTIKFTGDVIFSSDLTDGKTEISGDNIQTGTISLNRLELSNKWGSITMGRGTTGSDTTRGARLNGPLIDDTYANYFFASNAAARMTGEDLFGMNNFYVSVDEIHADMDIDISSDERLKNSIAYDLADRYEAFYRALKPARYHMNSSRSGRYHTGFIAQQLRDALQAGGLTAQDLAALVQHDHKKDPEGMYSIRYGELIALNTAFIQRLMSRVDALEDEIKRLRAET